MTFFTTTDGTKLHYIEEGSGDPIVFIHGWYANSHYFRMAAEKLKGTYRCLRYDQRGWGLSDSPVRERTIDRLVLDLREFIEHLDLNNVCLVGHSMGALVIYGYIERFGCEYLSSVMLMDMSPKPVPDKDWELGAYNIDRTPAEIEDSCCMGEVDKRLRKTVTAINSEYLKLMGSSMPGMLQGYAYLEQMNPYMTFTRPYPTVIMDYWLAMLNADYRDAASRITVPVIYVQPERSLYPASVAEYLEERSSAPVFYEMYEDTGHIEMIADYDRVYKSILRLKSHEGKDKTWEKQEELLEA